MEMTETVVRKKKGITGTALKLIALIAMFIDHFAAILITDYLNAALPANLDAEKMQAWFVEHPHVAMLEILMLVMRLIGRFGFPLFAFLIVEGFQHTRSVKKYALNLGVFALISELPFNLGFSSKLFFPGYQNVFFTLLLGLCCLACMHYFCTEKKGNGRFAPLFYLATPVAGAFAAYMFLNNCWIFQSLLHLELWGNVAVIGICAILSMILLLLLGAKWDVERRNRFSFTILSIALFCIFADLLVTDYGAGGVLVISVMYLLRAKKTKAFGIGCLILSLMSFPEVTAFLMLIPIAKYNGERGMKLNKYVFYAFYPLHIGLLYLVTLLLGFTTFALR